jgi:hypothetical protein
VKWSEFWVVCGVKHCGEEDSDRPLSDEIIRKVSIRIKYGVRLAPNQSQLR